MKKLECEVISKLWKEDKISALFSQMKEGIKSNLNKIKENKNFLEFAKTSKKTLLTKSIPRVFSKD